MAVKGSRKRPARGGAAANEAVEEVAEQPKSVVELSREKIRKRLGELMLPVLEKYGESAFNELNKRIETVVEEFTAEVETLFTDLVDKANTDHGKLIDLLTRDTDVTDGQEAAPIQSGESMSEYERRLEAMDSSPATETDNENGDNEGDSEE